MNTMQNLIIIKGKVKTKEIECCIYNRERRKYDVRFNNGREYSYLPANVCHLKNPKILQPENYRIVYQGKELFDIEGIRVFRDKSESYWHIFLKEGAELTFAQTELEISESCLSNPKSESVFSYLKQIAALSDIQDSDTGESLLLKRYEDIDFIDKDLVLANYLEGRGLDFGNENNFVPIFPFGCNASQYKAVKNAMEHQLSIIQGPPGTGKTQTILNILANILLLGKTVQIVSNNNSATENIYEKLASKEYQLEFIVASLGKTENKKMFIQNQTGGYPDFTNWELKGEPEISLASIRYKSILLQAIFEKEERAARLKQEISVLETEWKYFKKHFDDPDLNVERNFFKSEISSEKLLQLENRYRDHLERKKSVGLFFKIENMIRFGIMD